MRSPGRSINFACEAKFSRFFGCLGRLRRFIALPPPMEPPIRKTPRRLLTHPQNRPPRHNPRVRHRRQPQRNRRQQPSADVHDQKSPLLSSEIAPQLTHLDPKHRQIHRMRQPVVKKVRFRPEADFSAEEKSVVARPELSKLDFCCFLRV